MSFIISTDTSANLPDEYINRNNLLVIPFSYFENGKKKQCLSIDSFDDDAFYAGLKNLDVKTSMINVSEYCDAWRPVLEQGNDVLHISMSSGISGAYQAAANSAGILSEEFPDRQIKVFDSRAASLGEGMMVMQAVKALKSGDDIDEAFDFLYKMRENLHQLFTVDDLFHLRRGGRVTTGAAVFGTVLNIKPILTSDEEGRIILCGKARGRIASVKYLAFEMLEAPGPDLSEIIGIAYAGCEKDAKALARLIKQSAPNASIMTVCYEPVTGSHVGNGAVALFYFSEKAGESTAPPASKTAFEQKAKNTPVAAKTAAAIAKTSEVVSKLHEKTSEYKHELQKQASRAIVRATHQGEKSFIIIRDTCFLGGENESYDRQKSPKNAADSSVNTGNVKED